MNIVKPFSIFSSQISYGVFTDLWRFSHCRFAPLVLWRSFTASSPFFSAIFIFYFEQIFYLNIVRDTLFTITEFSMELDSIIFRDVHCHRIIQILFRRNYCAYVMETFFTYSCIISLSDFVICIIRYNIRKICVWFATFSSRKRGVRYFYRIVIPNFILLSIRFIQFVWILDFYSAFENFLSCRWNFYKVFKKKSM